ncbi:hypothetical protein [Pseudomonas fluorescens]|uniref:Calcium-binding protein n=1 Tax=Pseudomonas fluorescens TaxID=294 RepID=A0AAE2A6K9_PSEFL|nr:hypothetical protein [Pseudomonas fluorescens]KIF58899.1 hypothetical protein QS95_17565 [Pseudomonas fluorescens]
MATLILDSTINHNSVDISDIELTSYPKPASTIDFEEHQSNTGKPSESKRKTSELKVVDQVYGPLRIGNFYITRRSLDALGATLDGQVLDGKNTFFRTPSRKFIDGLQFDPVKINARMKTSVSDDDYSLTALLFEIASRRPLTSPTLLNNDIDIHADTDGYLTKLKQLLVSAQKLDIRHAHMSEPLPKWANRTASRTMAGTGIGLQAFGIYSGLCGLQDAVKNKDSYGIIFNSAAYTADITSIAVDLAVTHKATQMLKAGQSAYKGFAHTSFALKLGRGGGLIGGALTLPFDIISAVDSFNAAAKATGKEAVNHYVNAGLSVTSAAMTVLLGTAALAGFSSAGPIGLVAGLLLVAGSRIWAAINVVDDIDDYITLTTEERLRTGWFAFWGISPDESVENRHIIARAAAQHARQLQASARKLLDEDLKDHTEAVINGRFHVEVESIQIPTYHSTPENPQYKTIKRPRIVDDNDTIDARAGVTENTKGSVLGASSELKNILWFLGGGFDTVQGVTNKPNNFYYRLGPKFLDGGKQDDEFVFEGAADLLQTKDHSGLIGELDGGAGSDSLKLTGTFPAGHEERFGYKIDLKQGEMFVKVEPDKADGLILHSMLRNIENIDTLAGSNNEVIGTDGPNIIKARGKDHVDAGAGDDQIYVLSPFASIRGGPGKDTYALSHLPGNVVIHEEGTDESFIVLDWRSDLIESWEIKNADLIVTSGFDLDDDKKRYVRLTNLYDWTDNRTQKLRGGKLTFITRDGFRWIPELPEIIIDSQYAPASQIQVSMLQQGTRELPAILHSSDITVPQDKNTHYWISRNNQHTTLTVTEQKNSFLTTVYLDFSSAELSNVLATYNIEVLAEGELKNIMYRNCNLKLFFGEKSLSINNLASSWWRSPGRINNGLTRPLMMLNHSFVLILNDGVSYRLHVPPIADDHLSNYGIGHSQRAKAITLTPREGEHLYLRPLDNTPHPLGDQARCVRFSLPTAQTAIETLSGNGSTYLVHLSNDMSLRLSTPGAMASATERLAFSSTWELDATALGHVDITLSNNQLLIGKCTVHLPEYDNSEDLVDQIRVITASGIVHAVDLIFEAIYIESIDARFFIPPDDPDTPLPAEWSTATSVQLPVRNISMKDGTPGALSYHLSQRRWVLDTDFSRLVDVDDLKTINHCTHQMNVFEVVAKIALDYSPPISAQGLHTLRAQCAKLRGDLSLDDATRLERAKNLAWLLAGQSSVN